MGLVEIFRQHPQDFIYNEMNAGPSTHNAYFSHHGGASSSAEPHFDQFEDDNVNIQSPDVAYSSSEYDMDEEMDYVPTDEENDREEDVPTTINQVRLHPVLPFYSAVDPVVEGDSLGLSELEATKMVYDYRIGNLGLGLVFESKKSLQRAVKDYHITHKKREYEVQKINKSTWTVMCKHKDQPEQCEFYLRAHLNKKLNMWIISQFGVEHKCEFDSTSKKHPNLDMNLIAHELIPYVKENPAYDIKQIIVLIQQKWDCQISYGKAWCNLHRANEIVYGCWEDSVKYLPMFIGAIKKWNPQTVVEWRHKEGYENPKVFKYVFWAFRPCIDGF